MRARQVEELAVRSPTTIDLKYEPGGLAEAHFCAALVAAGLDGTANPEYPSDQEWLERGDVDDSTIAAVNALDSLESALRLRTGSSVLEPASSVSATLAKDYSGQSTADLNLHVEAIRAKVSALFHSICGDAP